VQRAGLGGQAVAVFLRRGFWLGQVFPQDILLAGFGFWSGRDVPRMVVDTLAVAAQAFGDVLGCVIEGGSQ
jgi:membrane protein DedA with SNARE-associated domain